MHRRNPTTARPFTRPLALATTIAIAIFGATGLAAGAEPPDAIDLEAYAKVLDRHTRTTQDLVGVRVDYAGIARDETWPALVAEVRNARPSRLSRDERLAFWINAYNILAIDLVIDHRPIESIKDIGSFFDPVWNRPVAKIEGRSVSLGQIEHDILRPMGDARIHGAIVCASTSCPPLYRKPFRAESIDADLSAAMRLWLESERKGVRIDRRANRVTISKIFDWFEEDFAPDGGALGFIARYVNASDATWLRDHGQAASIRNFDYDWSLNDVKR